MNRVKCNKHTALSSSGDLMQFRLNADLPAVKPNLGSETHLHTFVTHHI